MTKLSWQEKRDFVIRAAYNLDICTELELARLFGCDPNAIRLSLERTTSSVTSGAAQVDAD